MFEPLIAHAPPWIAQWSGEILIGLRLLLIMLVAWGLRWLLRRVVTRISNLYELPPELGVGAKRVGGFLIGFTALLAVMSVFGLSGGALWTAITGFAAVSAIAFFAAWSVLTNTFCAILLLITRPFRLYDHIELMDAGDRPGLRGQVIDMSMMYVTLAEKHPKGGESTLRIPNSLFFQRSTRRWRGEPEVLEYGQAGAAGTAPPTQAGAASALNFP